MNEVQSNHFELNKNTQLENKHKSRKVVDCGCKLGDQSRNYVFSNLSHFLKNIAMRSSINITVHHGGRILFIF